MAEQSYRTPYPRAKFLRTYSSYPIIMVVMMSEVLIEGVL